VQQPAAQIPRPGMLLQMPACISSSGQRNLSSPEIPFGDPERVNR